MLFTTGPTLDKLVEPSPATHVEVADAEVGAVSHFERLTQRRKKRLLDVVEDSRHFVISWSRPFSATVSILPLF
jgi:hypothetical protein